MTKDLSEAGTSVGFNMSKEQTDLLPCPFCGGPAEVIEGEECAYVQCIQVKMHRAMWIDGDNNAANDARDEWNRRASPSPAGGVQGVTEDTVEKVAAAMASMNVVASARERFWADLPDIDLAGEYPDQPRREPSYTDHITGGYGKETYLALARAAIEALIDPALSPQAQTTGGVERRQVDDDMEVLRRLADGDTIVFSQDGDYAWFTKGDRAFVGDAVIRLREKGLTERRCDDEENYRGMSEYDAISDAGRAALKSGAPDA